MSLWQRLRNVAPYHAHFLGSLNHAWLALVTLGIGIAVASPLSVLAGVAAYGLGLIFLPDLPVFKKAYDAKRQAAIAAQEQAEITSKEQIRAGLQKKLSPQARTRWQNFASLCRDLESKLSQTDAPNLMPDMALEKVADSHLLLLGMIADIRDYLQTAESEAAVAQRKQQIQADLEKLQKRTDLTEVEQRLILSREETLKNLQQQAEQAKRMQLNLELAQSELERLESQIAFLKAELISTPANQLSNRLGETLIQVEASQRVLQEGGMVNVPDLNTLLGEHA